MLKFNYKVTLLLVIAILGIISVFFLPPVPQDPAYHHFADEREFLSIPNFYNVISNFLFLIFGCLGIFLLLYVRNKTSEDPGLPADLCFFAGILLTGLGSSYYHLQPETDSLLWDRLPMTIAFMAFFSIILREYIDALKEKPLLFHLLFLGILSVAYWYKTEMEGQGDLRFYALVQFLPMLVIPLILVLFRGQSSFSAYYWLILAVYALAKLFEFLDSEVFLYTHLISGHSLKHLIASLAPLIYLFKLWKEKTSLILQTHYNYKRTDGPGSFPLF